LLGDRGIDPARSAGRAAAKQLLTRLRQRVLVEAADHARTIDAARTTPDSTAAMLNTYATLYHDRGLSSDTSLLSSFGVDRALDALTSSGLLGDRPVRRVALVGPGLDVINKADGYDFYPEQTIQPFALVESLIRLGLSAPQDLEVTTFDVSARVNQHVSAAVERARGGSDYIMQLPLRDTEPWSLALLRYWESVGTRIGRAVAPERVPPAAGRVRVRAVGIRADIVARIEARDLNIVLERLDLPADRLFDLVVATNVLAYYETFEQALAVGNIGRMLRPGGSFLSNQAVRPMPPMKPEVGEHEVVYSQRQLDHFFWYQKQGPSQVPRPVPTQ
jgi:SAM-dependent methyltransferase